MTVEVHVASGLPSIQVDVVERGNRSRGGWIRCEIGENLYFSTERLESYFFVEWQPIVFDALLLAAAVEFCDKVLSRPKLGWGREILLRLPVHDPDRWNAGEVGAALHETIEFLTGDRWRISFVGRKKPEPSPRQGRFSLPDQARAIIPYSDGLDSWAVGGLLAQEYGGSLVRVRLGSKEIDQSHSRKYAFTSVPYRVGSGQERFAETTNRSRGFKFTLLCGAAAFLSKAETILMTESGQGALGPALVTVGHAYEDYRNHPLFTDRMERLVAALFGHRVRYEFPRLWYTKGQTLHRYVETLENSMGWRETWSCWQDSRHSSVGGRKRQCGICASCMLRRLSIHAAGLAEPFSQYVWERLFAASLEEGVAAGFKKIGRAQREYAIAGALHLDHLAGLSRAAAHAATIRLNAAQLARSQGISVPSAETKLDQLLRQHETEWESFLISLGSKSFITNWVVGCRELAA